MNRTPTIEEIAKKAEIPEEDIIYALDAIATPMSLFEPVYQDGNDPLFLMDQICDKKNKEDTWIEHLSLQEAMNQLSGREYHIIEKRFFEGKTQTEVADEISISQAQVSRLEKGALKAMRNYLRWESEEFLNVQMNEFPEGHVKVPSWELFILHIAVRFCTAIVFKNTSYHILHAGRPGAFGNVQTNCIVKHGA